MRTGHEEGAATRRGLSVVAEPLALHRCSPPPSRSCLPPPRPPPPPLPLGQIALKNYDPSRDKRFSGTFKLPTVPRPNMKVCVLGNAVHCEEAERIGVEHKSVEDLKKFNKNKKIIKKFAKK